MLTVQTATYLNDAAAYLNKHLFNSQLPNVLITISRKKGALGYFFPGAFAGFSPSVNFGKVLREVYEVQLEDGLSFDELLKIAIAKMRS